MKNELHMAASRRTTYVSVKSTQVSMYHDLGVVHGQLVRQPRVSHAQPTGGLACSGVSASICPQSSVGGIGRHP